MQKIAAPLLPSLFSRRNWLYLLLWLAGSAAIVSCQKGISGEQAATAVTFKDVPYGSDPQQKMDIYLPAAHNDTTKVIILIHGGAWAEGDKSDFNTSYPALQQRLPGYAIFNINYRLAAAGSGNIFPAQENDVKAAVEFIYNKRAEYKISGKFVYLGASAGAHLALLQGYKYTTPVKAKTVVSFFGPTDLTGLFNSSQLAGVVLTQVTGTTPALDPTLYTQSSPSAFVTATAPPTILLQGGADTVVPPAQADAFNIQLATAGVPHQYVFYPTEGHGWAGANLDDSFNKIAAFLNQYVQ